LFEKFKKIMTSRHQCLESKEKGKNFANVKKDVGELIIVVNPGIGQSNGILHYILVV